MNATYIIFLADNPHAQKYCSKVWVSDFFYLFNTFIQLGCLKFIKTVDAFTLYFFYCNAIK